MWIERDFLKNIDLEKCLEAILLRGPRQVGKTTLLLKLVPTVATELYFDDPNIRKQAETDPNFLLSQSPLPVLIDEVQRAPEFLISLKNHIDKQRRERLKSNKQTTPAGFRLTGSNQTELDQALRESLSGRVSLFYFHSLSVHELLRFDSKILLNQLLFKGGFPEVWIRPEISPIQFYNNYLVTFVEKDIGRTAGITKLSEYMTMIRLIAARTAELLNFESLGRDAGVTGKIVKEWISVLEQNQILFLLKPYFSNLNNRLIKMPKAYFLDIGICTRLQGHQESAAILNTPQAGHLFENLVVAEIVKTKDNFQKDWSLFFWRTKDDEEVDLVIESSTKRLLIEVKLGSEGSTQFVVPKLFKTDLKDKTLICAYVTAIGSRKKLNSKVEQVSIADLCDYLLEALD